MDVMGTICHVTMNQTPRHTTPTDVTAMLRERGLRVTPQRLAICGRLLSENRHVTPQQLHDELIEAFPSLSPNTVYLTLSQLEEAGLVRRLNLGTQVVFDSNTAPHDHLSCDHCGALTDLDTLSPPAPPEELTGWLISRESRTFHGTCPRCRKQGKGGPARNPARNPSH